MDLFKFSERIMSMDDASWARHANPKSVYTRLASSPLIFAALWSIHWIGYWATLPILIVAIWVWLNPRLFDAPTKTTSWAARGVLGERVFLTRKTHPIPAEHHRIALISTTTSAVFMLIAIYGLIRADFWAAFTGWHAATLAKVWFVDRMAWLWDDMKDQTPTYQAWARADWTAPKLAP